MELANSAVISRVHSGPESPVGGDVCAWHRHCLAGCHPVSPAARCSRREVVGLGSDDKLSAWGLVRSSFFSLWLRRSFTSRASPHWHRVVSVRPWLPVVALGRCLPRFAGRGSCAELGPHGRWLGAERFLGRRACSGPAAAPVGGRSRAGTGERAGTSGLCNTADDVPAAIVGDGLDGSVTVA